MQKYKSTIKHLTIISIIFCLFLCGGCGKSEDAAPHENTADASDQDADHGQSIEDAASDVPAVSAEPEKAEATQPDPAPSAKDDAPQDPPDSPSDENVSDESASDGKLTAKELQEYTAWIQESSNYGFLLSEWSTPAEINLYEVFYNGAGLSREGTEAEINAFLTRYEQDELYTDFFAIDKTAVNNLLIDKVGLSYDELLTKGGRGMEDIYYAESDSFCFEVGDTNLCLFECVDGSVNEDGTVITLYFEGDFWVKKCEVKILSDSRRFLSNHIMEGEILDTLNMPE